MSTSTASLPKTPIAPAEGQPAWKSELNAKLQAHRERRSPFTDAPGAAPARHESSPASPATRAAAARVAARVAERYAKAPSYSEVLAANAAAASAAAETAALAAQEAHDAARALLSSLAERDHALATEALAGRRPHQGVDAELAATRAPVAGASDIPSSPTVEHHEPLPPRPEAPPRALGQRSYSGIVDAIAEATVPPAMSLPAKLIEFPRELIAAHKSRPRLAEGPLLEEAEAQVEPSSLRIFEVAALGQRDTPAEPQAEAPATTVDADATERGLFDEPGAQSHGPLPTTPEARRNLGRSDRGAQEQAGAPEWQSIRLGAHPGPRGDEQPFRGRQQQPETSSAAALYTAKLSDRVMAALVDLAVVGAAFLVFVLVFASCTAHPPLDKTALGCAGLLLLVLAIFYQWLFLSYGCATPGMRYARIALCTFEDENPTRQALRSRVWAGLLAALPLGLGLLWAIFDEDSLGWHDRMSRTYQRSYR